MKRKHHILQDIRYFFVCFVAALFLLLLVLFSMLRTGAPSSLYAPGLYRVADELTLYQWHDINVSAYFFPACALLVSDGYTYLTVDPDMTSHCGE